MTSQRQISANRLNARKSTGPRTVQGKFRSRRNALRHGLTAQTIIHGIEDCEEYRAFEAAILAEYGRNSMVARQLTIRLASLLWRLRRAAAIETGLMSIQARIMQERRHTTPSDAHLEWSRDKLYGLLGLSGPQKQTTSDREEPAPTDREKMANAQSVNLAQCFLRTANLSGNQWDRLSRYEIALWRQAAQTLIVLGAMNRHKINSFSRPSIAGSLAEATKKAPRAFRLGGERSR